MNNNTLLNRPYSSNLPTFKSILKINYQSSFVNKISIHYQKMMRFGKKLLNSYGIVYLNYPIALAWSPMKFEGCNASFSRLNLITVIGNN